MGRGGIAPPPLPPLCVEIGFMLSRETDKTGEASFFIFWCCLNSLNKSLIDKQCVIFCLLYENANSMNYYHKITKKVIFECLKQENCFKELKISLNTRLLSHCDFRVKI